MKKSFLAILISVSSLAVLFTGCGSPKLETTSAYVRRDGTVAAAVYEPFDTTAYKEESLLAFIENAVSEYNEKTCGIAAVYKKDTKESLPVRIDSFKIKSGVAILQMEYASCSDYNSFNQGDELLTDLWTGTVADLELQGKHLKDLTLVTTDGSIYSEDIDEKAYAVLAKGSEKILVQGKILCTSRGVKVTDKNTAEIDPISDLNVIIFKK